MEDVDSLVQQLQALAEEQPARRDFVSGMLRAIERILQDFDGEVRDELLREARQAFERQQAVQRHTRRATAALDQLEAQQAKLARAIERLAVRPPGATLH